MLRDVMPDGCSPSAGYDISVNGIGRTFRDRHSAAIEAGIFLKLRWPQDVVKIHDRGTGQDQLVLPDGRLG